MNEPVKVLDVHCMLTGTEDYGHYDDNNSDCKLCTYKKMCVAQFNETELEDARGMWLEGQKMAEESQLLIDTARRIFEQQATKNDILKYQYGHIVVNRIYIKEQTTYPKKNLERIFTFEQLKPCAEIRPATWQTRINDLLKEKKNHAD